MAKYNYYKDLQIQPQSGLSFPWAEYHPDPVQGSFSAALGADGVTVGMKMLINWSDLNKACVELLGYTQRKPSYVNILGATVPPRLNRILPWQHPYWNQLYVKRIAEVKGIQQLGRSDKGTSASFNVVPVGNGPGYAANQGPWTKYKLAELTIQFWRPNYYVRSDNDITNTNGVQQEWLRYVSKTWEMSLSMLSREGSTFQWLPALRPPYAYTLAVPTVGQPVAHYRMSRTWYQIPEAAIFSSVGQIDFTPQGLATNLIYSQTPTVNPMSLYDLACGSTVVGTTTTALTAMPSPGSLLNALPYAYVYPAGSPIAGCVNAPIGGSAVDANGTWIDGTTQSRFFGCYTGTLRFDSVTIEPVPLQLPPYLMGLLSLNNFGSVEPLSQNQYNVTFHFDLFDPPPGPIPGQTVAYGTPIKGHNLVPYSGNGLWYPILSQKDQLGFPQSATTVTTISTQGTTTTTNITTQLGSAGAKLTMFQYADFSDLFQIL